MKTIPVCALVAGLLLPAVCFAETDQRPDGPQRGEKGERRGAGGASAEAWQMADSNKDGFISQPELEVMPRIQNLPEDKRGSLFKRLDKDGDGKLSRDELGRFGKPPGDHGPPMQRLWELDSNKSGGIDFEEFKTGGFFKKLPPDKQDIVFKRLDTDGDGVVTPKDRPEPHHRRKSDGKRGPKGDRPSNDDGADQPGHINKKLDLNGDGALSFEEFRAGPAVKDLTEDQQEDRFELLDQNGDGKISSEDVPAPEK